MTLVNDLDRIPYHRQTIDKAIMVIETNETLIANIYRMLMREEDHEIIMDYIQHETNEKDKAFLS